MAGTLIVDDHPLFRDGLRAALEAPPDALISGEFAPFSAAGSVAEATRILESPGNGLPALVILDISLPDGSGFDILEQFASRHGSPRFLMLSMHAERSLAIRAIRAGANGYASKQIPLESLLLGLDRKSVV